MTATKLPQAVLDLRGKLSVSDAYQRMDTLAPLLGMPKYSDVPRPGECSNWTIDEWKNWAKPWPFVSGETTHSWTLTHPYPTLVISRSKSTGDARGAMQCCTDFRRTLANVLDTMAKVLIHLIDKAVTGQFHNAPDSTDPEIWIGFLISQLEDASTGNGIRGLIEAYGGGAASEADTAAFTQIPGLLKTLDREFGKSPRKTMVEVGLSESSADGFLVYIRQQAKPYPRSAILAIEMRAILDECRALRKFQQDEKAAQRLAERTARERQKDPATKDKYDVDVNSTRAKIRSHFATQLTIAENLVKTAQRNLETISQIPFPDYPGAPQELIAKNEAMSLAYDEAASERDALRERADEDLKTIARLEQQLAESGKKAAVAESATDLRKSAHDVLDAIKSLDTTDLFKLPTAIASVRAKGVTLAQLLAKN